MDDDIDGPWWKLLVDHVNFGSCGCEADVKGFEWRPWLIEDG